MTEPAKIYLGEGLFAVVDSIRRERLCKYNWYPEVFHSSTYAVADIVVRGHKKKLRMHRLVANTPPQKITHHINHITLDNRRENLLNCTKQEHNELHNRGHIRIKYEKNPTIGTSKALLNM